MAICSRLRVLNFLFISVCRWVVNLKQLQMCSFTVSQTWAGIGSTASGWWRSLLRAVEMPARSSLSNPWLMVGGVSLMSYYRYLASFLSVLYHKKTQEHQLDMNNPLTLSTVYSWWVLIEPVIPVVRAQSSFKNFHLYLKAHGINVLSFLRHWSVRDQNITTLWTLSLVQVDEVLD